MASGQTPKIAPGWWALVMVLVVVGAIVLTGVFFTGGYKSHLDVTLTSDRSGLVLERGAKVKFRGVQVGEVGEVSVHGSTGTAALRLRIDPDDAQRIPANADAEIKSTTAFGAKYVSLEEPEVPSPSGLRAGAVLRSKNVTTEVNTVFENLTNVLQTIDPAKLNATLGAVAEGLRGQGDELGHAITDSDEVLAAWNPLLPTLQRDLRALTGAADAYSASAQDILGILRNASVTSQTITTEQKKLDELLIASIGLTDTGNDVLGSSKNDLIKSINLLEPTTNLLYKYQPTYTCLLMGAKWFLDNGGYDVTGGQNGYSVILDAGILAGDNRYEYPKNLPKVAATGGPGGKPGCGSLPDPSKSFPVKALVTDTGYGANPGDIAAKPAIGNPTFIDFLFGNAEGPGR
jgi:phospholipid/cholesterol/gamma-HCH transport system substrate-binding protein